VPLTKIPVGDTVTIRRIHELGEENAELLAFLEAKKLMPGARATVTEILPFNHTISVEVNGQAVILGFAAAKYVYGERVGV
jgi:Fe2+ transport system protein FeoA